MSRFRTSNSPNLGRRLAETRWPSAELVADRSQGVQRETLQALMRYWTDDYNWRKLEAKLNALRQFTPRSTVSASTSSTPGRRMPTRCR
jgi:hypothetical protein